MRRVISMALSGFKYIIGLFMMYAGITTMFTPVEGNSDLGFLYQSRVALVTYGVIFFVCGFWLVLSKIKHWQKHIGYSLMAIYLCFLYAGILVWAAHGLMDASANLIAALILGGLYLRWKYRVYYADRVDRRTAAV